MYFDLYLLFDTPDRLTSVDILMSSSRYHFVDKDPSVHQSIPKTSRNFLEDWNNHFHNYKKNTYAHRLRRIVSVNFSCFENTRRSRSGFAHIRNCCNSFGIIKNIKFYKNTWTYTHAHLIHVQIHCLAINRCSFMTIDLWKLSWL